MYLSRTVPDIENLLQPLEDAIRQRLLPSITSQNPFSDTERDLMALPARLNGMGITNPANQAENQYHASRNVTSPIVEHLIQQSRVLPPEAKYEQAQASKLPLWGFPNHPPQ